MRRLLAAIAAVVMVAVGFIVWQARNDSSSKTPGTSASDIKTIWCVPEAEAACRKTTYDVAIYPPTEIETLAKKAGSDSSTLGPDAIVAPAQWLTRYATVLPSLRVDRTPLASTEIVSVEKVKGLNCQGKMTCLLAKDVRLGLPSISRTSSGLVVAAIALRAQGATDLSNIDDPKVSGATNALTAHLTFSRTVDDPLTSLLNLSLLDAAVMTRADFGDLNRTDAVVSPLLPGGSLTVGVAVFGSKNQPELHKELQDVLLATVGWKSAVTASAGPDDRFLNKTYEILGN
jgi:hypothetical protein